MSKKEQQVVYYNSETEDDFSDADITPKVIDENYKYLHSSMTYNILSFIAYRIIATPLAFLYCKLKFRYKTINKKALKKHKKEGYFLYGNHTQQIGDAYLPTMAVFPKRNYVIVHPDNVSMPVLGKITPMLGAMPLPSNLKAGRNFLNAIEKRILQNHCVTIYPEAKIWPYYTKIRPFPATSFKYPVKFDTPCYCFTHTYHKRKHSKKPRIITYIDGPFYANPDLPVKEQEQDLRDRVYNQMVERSKLNTYEYIKYVKRKDTND